MPRERELDRERDGQRQRVLLIEIETERGESELKTWPQAWCWGSFVLTPPGPPCGSLRAQPSSSGFRKNKSHGGGGSVQTCLPPEC